MQKHYDIQERGQLEELPDGWFYQRDGNNKERKDAARQEDRGREKKGGKGQGNREEAKRRKEEGERAERGGDQRGRKKEEGEGAEGRAPGAEERGPQKKETEDTKSGCKCREKSERLFAMQFLLRSDAGSGKTGRVFP